MKSIIASLIALLLSAPASFAGPAEDAAEELFSSITTAADYTFQNVETYADVLNGSRRGNLRDIRINFAVYAKKPLYSAVKKFDSVETSSKLGNCRVAAFDLIDVIDEVMSMPFYPKDFDDAGKRYLKTLKLCGDALKASNKSTSP